MMRKILGSTWDAIAQHGFIVLLSLAAITHSAWSINSVFGGTEPLPMYSEHWWGWFIPGLLMSITIDVGLLAFVTRLQKGERQFSLILGYLLLCALMAFGQFVYVASHIANFTLAAGVADYYHDLANGIIKAALFVYPAALPVVSAVYAFSVRQKTVTSTVEPSIDIDAKSPQIGVNFVDIDDSMNTRLATGETTNLALPENVKSGAEEKVNDSLLIEQSVMNSALVMPKREYAIRTTEHHCAHCGVAFAPKSANQKYHSASCRTLAYEQRKTEGSQYQP